MAADYALLYRTLRLRTHSMFRQLKKPPYLGGFLSGGEGGIRTLETVASLTVFKTVPFNHSGTSPRRKYSLDFRVVYK